MPAKRHETHKRLDKGETIEFCPATQSWWPKGRQPEGRIVTVAALLDEPAVYEPTVGMRTRDIQFTPLADDADTELDADTGAQ